MKRFLGVILIFASISLSAQTKKYQLSGGVLDSATGKSTAGIRVKLDKYDESTETWDFVSETITGSSERFLERKEGVDNKGIYKMTFYTAKHYEEMGIESIFPFIEVNVNIMTDEDYMIPVVMTPFSYTTYRGNGYSTPKQ